MARKADGTRLNRLEELKGLLREREHATAAELAAEMGVSLRTLNRDIALLRQSGLPIDADRGRGGGMQLHRSWSLGRLHLDHLETIDLLLSITIAEKVGSPLLLQYLTSIKRKVSAAFAEGYQGRIRDLRRRIIVGGPATLNVVNSYVPPSRANLALVSQAFFEQRQVIIDYEARDGVVTSRRIEPQFLYLNAPVWYLITWDHLRDDIRTFRVDRIRSAELQSTTFRVGDPKIYIAAADQSASLL
ncbi:putative DNA-binding transcriptional regulator YafY [Rhizobium sp. BK313]|jgi:predicted DNA-binding transcriptional regulator YafY|uniref:helix-turn-helix transcriptional regulator n=1 Tax=Rhizobium sp. BK313 TaxID=2587081 RepID=UPI001061EE9B|nr:WYL domain-containing protein [Rhizobium sp. BK313]MBB3452848.1 putative DNA-binding transcriptional regulator YafY [Rhizobium sp. BK313]